MEEGTSFRHWRLTTRVAEYMCSSQQLAEKTENKNVNSTVDLKICGYQLQTTDQPNKEALQIIGEVFIFTEKPACCKRCLLCEILDFGQRARPLDWKCDNASADRYPRAPSLIGRRC